MEKEIEYYSRFLGVLRNALANGAVKFPSSLQKNYQDLTVFRGVGYSKNKTKIDKSDFLSNVERNMKNPMVLADYDNISSYSCSCYLKIEKMRICAKFPRKNRAIAKGNRTIMFRESNCLF